MSRVKLASREYWGENMSSEERATSEKSGVALDRLLDMATQLENLAASIVGKIGWLGGLASLAAVGITVVALRHWGWGLTSVALLAVPLALPGLVLGLVYLWLLDAVGLPERVRELAGKVRPQGAASPADATVMQAAAAVPANPPVKRGMLGAVGGLIGLLRFGNDLRELAFAAQGLLWFANPFVLGLIVLAALGALALIVAAAITLLVVAL